MQVHSLLREAWHKSGKDSEEQSPGSLVPRRRCCVRRDLPSQRCSLRASVSGRGPREQKRQCMLSAGKGKCSSEQSGEQKGRQTDVREPVQALQALPQQRSSQVCIPNTTGMQWVRVVMSRNGQRSQFGCHTYQLTKQVQTGKENRKKVRERAEKHLLSNVFTALVVLPISHKTFRQTV